MNRLNAQSVLLPLSTNPTRWFSSTVAGAVLTGTDGPDSLASQGRNSTLVGGAGDDTYTVSSNTILVVEQPNGGIDTLVTHSLRAVLPEHVENLTALAANASAIGNADDNIVIGGSGAQTLAGAGGNDVLAGGAGADVFVLRQGWGSDVITDFTPRTDKLRIEDYALYDFAAVQAAMVQSGADTVITLGGNERVILRNVQASGLTAGDFMLASDPARPGMRLTFREEFDGFSASATGDGTVWKTAYGVNKTYRTHPNNFEAQYYTDPSVGGNPFALAGGVLSITAAPGSNPLNLPYNSGAITTARFFAQQYGYFEVRAQLPSGQGFWPAFWLLPATGAWPPEIDIFEVLGHDTSTLHASLHSNTSPDVSAAIGTFRDLSAGFNTYGLSWQADRIRWYLNDTLIAEQATPADMHQPMFMLLNLGVGDTGSWPGRFDPGMPTVQMLIDHVRVWQTGTGATLESWVRGPADAAAFGGFYSMAADGTSDRYDFGKSTIALRMDATGLDGNIPHTFTGTMLGDVVINGAATLNGSLGAGDDIFYFGTGASRLNGNAGNDTFVFTAGSMSANASILDFQADLGDGTDHDQLRFEGFSPGARLELVGTSGSVQSYRVVDGAHVSPIISVRVINTTAPLSELDYAFTATTRPDTAMPQPDTTVEPPAAGAPPDAWVRGPADATDFGGLYTLAADGTSDRYDFGRVMLSLRMDATQLATSVLHNVTGTMLGDIVVNGAATLNGSLGAGDDIFYFGTGASRLNGNAGNDTFVFTAASMSRSASILDFQADLGDGTEHDQLRFDGFSPGARLELVGTSGSVQSYRVVDGAHVSPIISVRVINTTAPLSELDYLFT